MKILFVSDQVPQNDKVPYGGITYEVSNQSMVKLFDTARKTIIFKKDRAVISSVVRECRNIVGDDSALVLASLNIFFSNVRDYKKAKIVDLTEMRKCLTNGYGIEFTGIDLTSNQSDTEMTEMVLLIFDHDHKDVFDNKLKVLGLGNSLQL